MQCKHHNRKKCLCIPHLVTERVDWGLLMDGVLSPPERMGNAEYPAFFGTAFTICIKSIHPQGFELSSPKASIIPKCFRFSSGDIGTAEGSPCVPAGNR